MSISRILNASLYSKRLKVDRGGHSKLWHRFSEMLYHFANSYVLIYADPIMSRYSYTSSADGFFHNFCFVVSHFWLMTKIFQKILIFLFSFLHQRTSQMESVPYRRLSANENQSTAAKEGAMRWSADTNQCTSTRGLPNWCPHLSPSCRLFTCKRPPEKARSDQ